LRNDLGSCVGPVLVVNQALDAKEASAVHARIGGVCEKFLGSPLPLLGWVPRDDRVPEAVRRRRPFLVEHPRSAASRAVHTLAAAAEQRLEPRRPGGRRPEGLSDLLSRLVLRGR
jgi:flagellar biosynthesis protein FlhG